MKKENNQIGFELQSIRLEQFATFDANHSSKKDSDLGTGLQLRIDQKNKQVACFMAFEFAQKTKVFLKIEVLCAFQIEENSWLQFIQTKLSKIVIPKEFLAHLAMITTGTSRGILFTKTEGTAYTQYILPSVNVTELIPDDVVFDLN